MNISISRFALVSLLILSPALASAASGSKPDTYSSVDSNTRTYSRGSSEDWKGSANPSDFNFSALGGIGVIDDYHAGFSLIGAVAKKILDRGFVPDINNQVFIEGEIGPVFVAGNTAWFYSVHGRWDFTLNPDWTFYALGGVGGSAQGSGLGSHTVFFPRIGAGAMMSINEQVALRFELSHELIVVGGVFRL
ncbi:MAG: hypothetical protein P4M08_05850 [Oligoflexia bacterium]|nr:hypothetical protein [Oligoflexia bacterium]